MGTRAQTVAHLRRGNPLRFDLVEVEWHEGHELLDDLERLVGLPLERREIVEAQGRAIICWIRGLGSAPIVEQYKGVDHVRHA